MTKCKQGSLAAGFKGSGAKHKAQRLARSEAQASLSILLTANSKESSDLACHCTDILYLIKQWV